MNIHRIRSPWIRRPLMILTLAAIPVITVFYVLLVAVTETIPDLFADLPESVARCWRGDDVR